jgi:hypothetical protein
MTTYLKVAKNASQQSIKKKSLEKSSNVTTAPIKIPHILDKKEKRDFKMVN